MDNYTVASSGRLLVNLQRYACLHNENRSIDEKIYHRLQEKERIMLDAIAEQKLEALPTDDDGLAAIFEGMFS